MGFNFFVLGFAVVVIGVALVGYKIAGELGFVVAMLGVMVVFLVFGSLREGDRPKKIAKGMGELIVVSLVAGGVLLVVVWVFGLNC